MSNTPNIGQRIRAVRRRAGLSQDAFATALGYSKRSLIAWETGAVEPPLGILSKLRRDYDVDPEWIVAGEDETPRSHYGPVDWERFDRLTQDVGAVCTDVGLSFPPEQRAERHQALARVQYDEGRDAGQANRKQLRRMLLALSLGD